MDNENLILSTSTSTLSLAIHPLPILNISEHWTRERVQAPPKSTPTVLGVLLGTQNGREVEIVNSFELGLDDAGGPNPSLNHAFLVSRRDLYKEVFPSLDFIGWYTVAQHPTKSHVALNEQFTAYSSTPLMLLLQPSFQGGSQSLPFRAFEPTMEIRDRRSLTFFINVPYTVETGEAERIAVDFTGKGGEQGSTLSSHLSTQRSAVQMLHERIQVLIGYLSDVIDGKAPKDHQTLRALSSLVASVPASENSVFRDEFEDEFTDVQLTSYLSALMTSTNSLSELVDKHIVHTASKAEDRSMMPRRRGMMGMMGMRGHDMMDRYGM